MTLERFQVREASGEHQELHLPALARRLEPTMLAHELRPPLFLARTPHGYHDTGTIRDELQAAGFVQVAIDTVEWRSWRPSLWHPAIGFCQGTPLRLEIEAWVPGRLGEVIDAARAVAAQFGDGPFEGRIQAHVIIASR